MTLVDPSNAAARWFEIRAEYEYLGPVAKVLRNVRELVLSFLTAGVFLEEWDPKRFCDVLVLRRDTGEPVAIFTYDHLGEATRHVRHLWNRLESTQVFDFCRELSVPMNAVAGEGQERVPDPSGLWKPVRSKDRRTARASSFGG